MEGGELGREREVRLTKSTILLCRGRGSDRETGKGFIGKKEVADGPSSWRKPLFSEEMKKRGEVAESSRIVDV